MEFDFGGYATRNDVLCTDGRIIRKNAFKAQNGQKVPLVWMHQRNDPTNVLGHAYLENRDDGVYCYCKFNNSSRGQHAKLLVEHGDINSLSIFANDLVQKGANVTHGAIREVSLVIAPANSGALIDNPVVQHGDEEYEDTTKAIISMFSELEHGVEFDIEDFVEHAESGKKPVKMEGKTKKKPVEEPEEDEEEPEDEEDEDLEDDEPDDAEDDSDEDDTDDEEEKNVKKPNTKSMQHADDSNDDEETVQDVYDTLTDKQKKVVAFLIGSALADKEDEDDTDDNKAEHSYLEGEIMPRNVFDQNNTMEMASQTPSLSHDQLSAIMDDAVKCGSYKTAFLAHAQEYGIENIDILFPDAKMVGENPALIKRDTEWVAGVLSETTHVPFSRIKSVAADLTADEARAKGYVKGNKKKEEVVKLLKRVTTPTTVYKKQKLDRDDIVDITDLNVVAWLKAEMRIMLNEELARAFLIGDGREIEDDDKIDEECIRPIWKDDDMYAHHVVLEADVADEDLPEEILKAQEEYNGSGTPSMYATSKTILKMLLLKDKIGRRLYNTDSELGSALGVKKLVRVPVMDRQVRKLDGGSEQAELIAILVNLRDYTVGATAGGAVSMFDDFDIDFNQYKYLIETRCSGTLTVPKSAIVIERKVAGGMG